MTVVIDASAAIALVGERTGADEFVRDAIRIVAPDLIIAEALNVRWKYRRAGLPAPALEALLALFDRIDIVGSRSYAEAADALSLELQHPIYDCLYAAVARHESGRLLTADRKFARKLGSSDVDVAVFS